MDRRHVIAGLGALPILTGSGMATDHQRPNIIYICVDDLGTQLNCYGNAQVHSPHFDAFSRRSLVFDRAFCQVAVCTASRTSILLGKRPELTGLTGLNHDWQSSLPGTSSLPKRLNDHGYRTVSIGKIWDPRAGDGIRQGWDQQESVWGISDNEAALDAVRSSSASSTPFALFVGYRAPHCPWEPGEAALSAYEGRIVTADGPGRRIESDYLQTCSGTGHGNLSDSEAHDIARRYYASVTEVDALIGAFLAELDRLDLFDSSIIVLWSGDHGYHLGENDHWGKWRNDIASTRIPLMLHVPGLTPRGQRTTALVEAIDMAPTLLDLVGAPLDGLHGHSLVPLLNTPDRDWFTTAFSVWGDPDVVADSHAGRSVKTKDWNLIQYSDGRTSLRQYADQAPETEVDASDAPEVYNRLLSWMDEAWPAPRRRR